MSAYILNDSLPLFEIKNLACSYNGADIVLEIDHLTIPRGKMIAILGASGAGKSTILESLGLMNKTFINGSQILFYDMNGEQYSFESLWNSKKPDDIEFIRNQHFSFIFQETNLMQNFTAYENACLSQMIQGRSFSEAMNETRKHMVEIGLAEIDINKKAHELSGGQKQRLAFIRAITPQYTVLFGDEPTGNLDEKTSEDLISILKNDTSQKGVSVIIVTHNIKLSVRFADIIMVITKKDKTGRLEEKNIFFSQSNYEEKIWKNLKDEEIPHMEDRIKKLL